MLKMHAILVVTEQIMTLQRTYRNLTFETFTVIYSLASKAATGEYLKFDLRSETYFTKHKLLVQHHRI